MEEHRVRSVAELVRKSCEIRDNWIEGPNYFDPWFRGHAKTSWCLEPKIFRLELLEEEDEIRSEFERRASQYSLEPVPTDFWGWYFLMQHYGAPTRLLDWTDSVLVALFFALNSDELYPDDREDAVVWVLDPWWLNQRVLGSDSIQLRNFHGASDYLASPYKNINGSRGTTIKSALPVAIDPPFLARRLAVQRSHFTVFGSDRDALENLSKEDGSRMAKIILAKDWLPQMRADLLTAGISDTTIYPDLHGLAAELTRYHLGTWPPTTFEAPKVKKCRIAHSSRHLH
jgi:hypothetical protein